MADDRPFDAFFRITVEGEHIVIAVRGQQYDATSRAAREIASNLLRAAERIEDAQRQKLAASRTARTAGPRRLHLVKP